MPSYIKPISIKKEHINEFEEWCNLKKSMGKSVSSSIVDLILKDLKELKDGRKKRIDGD